MRLVDSHCHLEIPDFGDEREAVMDRARQAGVAHFVAVGSGSSLANVDNAIALAEAHADVSAAIGIHPHDVARMAEGTLATIERLAHEHPKVVAVGETGLDYHYDHSPRAAQQQHFRDFIRIARGARKPLTLHIRSANDPARGDAHLDAQRILVEEQAFDVPVVVHCYTGDAAQARQWLALGACLSFSGILTFKSATPIQEAATLCPADRFLVETDCPYLAPIPHRGKRNEPAWVTETVRKIAVLRGVDYAEAARLSTENAARAFRLPLAG